MTKSQAINLARRIVCLPKDKGTGFMNYYGHTNNVYVQVHVPDWDSNRDPKYSFVGNIDGHRTTDVEEFIKEALTW